MSTVHANHPPAPTAAEVDAVRLERARYRARQVGKSRATLHLAADVVAVIGWFVVIGGIGVGALIAFNGDDTSFGDETDYSHLGLGVGVGVGGLIVGAVMILLAVWATAWVAEHDAADSTD